MNFHEAFIDELEKIAVAVGQGPTMPTSLRHTGFSLKDLGLINRKPKPAESPTEKVAFDLGGTLRRVGGKIQAVGLGRYMWDKFKGIPGKIAANPGKSALIGGGALLGGLALRNAMRSEDPRG